MTWLRQAAVLAVGVVLAGVMVVLGVWQLDVYHDQGRAQSERRASQPAVPVGSVARAGAPIGDGYGRPVSFSGRYLPQDQLLVPLDDPAVGYRVVAAVRLEDGDVLPVVRGLVTSAQLPAAPEGTVSGTGVLLPSEEAPPGTLPAGQISSVRLPTLAQQWPGPLVAGYVTLAPAEAAAQRLSPAPLDLPEASGRLRNGAYALQWWVFAAFALGMAVKVARDQGLPAPDDLDLDLLAPVGEDEPTDGGPEGARVGDLTAGEHARAT